MLKNEIKSILGDVLYQYIDISQRQNNEHMGVDVFVALKLNNRKILFNNSFVPDYFLCEYAPSNESVLYGSIDTILYKAFLSLQKETELNNSLLKRIRYVFTKKV